MMNKLFTYASGLRDIGVHIARWGIVVVFIWIGGLNVLEYKPYGVVPFVSYSPKAISDSLEHAATYKQYTGEDYNATWELKDNTNSVLHGLGALFIIIGVMVALYALLPGVSAAGSFLVFLMSLFTIIFFIAAPGDWTTATNAEHEFLHLTAEGGHVATAITMLGASIITMADSARKYSYNFSYLP